MRNIFASKEKEDQQQHLEQDEQDAKNLVEDFYTQGIRIRRPYEKQWYKNMAFFLGQQWISWNKVRNALEIPPAPSWRVRLVSNKIMPTVLHSVARMTQNKPTYLVIPSSSEDIAVNSAEISRKVLEYTHRINQMDIDRKSVV